MPKQILRRVDGWPAGRLAEWPVAKHDIKANSAQLELELGLSLAKCNILRELCNCTQKCLACNLFKMSEKIESLNKHLACTCENNFIESLRTKLSIKHNLEATNHDDNIIDAGQQSDVSEEIDDRLSKLSMIPQDPGQTVDLSHVSEELKVIMETPL